MISQQNDLSDVYCASYMKNVIERVWNEIHANSVFSRIIDEYNPRGVNQGEGFSRISNRKFRSWSGISVVDTADNVIRFSRTLKAGNGMHYKISIDRSYRNIGRNVYQFTEDFTLKLEILDMDLISTPYVKSDFGRLYFDTGSMGYNKGDDFGHFCVSMVQQFNTPNRSDSILRRFADKKKWYAEIHKATGRF